MQQLYMITYRLQQRQDDPEASYENILRYQPWIVADVVPVATAEDAFPVIQRVYE